MAQDVLRTPPSELTELQLASRKRAVPQVDGQATYTVTVELTNVRGMVQLNGSNTGAVGDYDYVGLYKAPLPSDPNSNGYVTFRYVEDGLPYVTGETYGPGWVGAYVAYDYLRGTYKYLARTETTT